MPKKNSIKLRIEQIEELCKNIEAGAPFVASALAVGIPESTFFKYKQEAEELYKKIKENPEIREEIKSKDKNDKEKILLEFIERIKKAEAKAILRNVAIINQAATENWQAAAWWLERRYPNQFGKRVEIDGEIQHRHSVEDLIKELREKRNLRINQTGMKSIKLLAEKNKKGE